VVPPKLYKTGSPASGRNSGSIDLKWDDAEQLMVDGLRKGCQGTSITASTSGSRRTMGWGHWFISTARGEAAAIADGVATSAGT